MKFERIQIFRRFVYVIAIICLIQSPFFILLGILTYLTRHGIDTISSPADTRIAVVLSLISITFGMCLVIFGIQCIMRLQSKILQVRKISPALLVLPILPLLFVICSQLMPGLNPKIGNALGFTCLLAGCIPVFLPGICLTKVTKG